MFQVDRPKNRLKRLEERKFSDLHLKEREHLWPAPAGWSAAFVRPAVGLSGVMPPPIYKAV